MLDAGRDYPPHGRVLDTHVNGVGVEQTSCYQSLSNPLNVIGKRLKPKSHTILMTILSWNVPMLPEQII